jgi:predicted acyltransferase
VLVRAGILFLIALFYSGGFTNEWPNMRLLGVLNRIALAYAGAGLLFCFLRPRGLAIATVAILAGYWALMTFIPIRDIALDKNAMIARFGPKPTVEQVQQAYDATTTTVTGRYEPGLNVSNHFDFNYLPGRKYDVYWDPEGIVSTLPAVATCLLGVFAGLLMRRTDFSDRKKIAWLAAGGAAALALGFLWGLQFPIVKKIWTSSFVLVAGGWSALLLALFYYLIDVRGWRAWSRPFVWIGMNPITLYVIHGNLIQFPRQAARFTGGSVKAFFERTVATGFGDVVLAATSLALVFLLAWFLHRRRIFLRV